METQRIIFEMTKKELSLLKEFLKVLKEERDSIISFSLEGIVRENNRKEELLKKIEFLENEKEKIMSDVPDRDSILKGEGWETLSGDVVRTMSEVNVAMEKNVKLLSFSMDHVRSSVENIVGFINKATYGRKQQVLSYFPARHV